MRTFAPTEYAAELQANEDEVRAERSAARWEGLIFGFLIGLATCLVIALLR